ncbi:glycosyltransferase family 4 protein [Weeksellaceae bacterium KMM 9724]|uniref:glycosyltransferase family 4 protein n=1 Tax=Profundicola chukchiensis TaxID=2961959 RepID=UPI0024385E35|nr:glycosyltransferase family 4 protein [Profundicola chukchiensis]MDG4949893.1 glycosyltransferase family 4 protein [Profundicola chukchiensis]
MAKPKLIRVTTVPISLDKLLEGQLKFMSETYEVIAVSSPENNYLKQIAEREGVAFHPIPLTRAITPIQDFKSLWEMYRFLKKEKPQIIHSHTPKAGTISMLAAKMAGVPIRLHTVAGLPLMEATGLKRKLLNTVEKITYWAATKVLPNSEGLKEIILKEGFTKNEKLHVIGKGSSNGIDTSYFDPNLFNDETKHKLRESLNIRKQDFVFVFVGRVVKDKGIVELVNAFKAINAENIKLLLVGTFEHELDPLPQEIISEIENSPHIILTGWQKDVRPYLAISDALTFPSYREGFPNVVMQAGAMGLPAIVSNINGCNEIIHHHENGLIIPVKDKIRLEQAMLNLLKDHTLYHNLKSQTRSNIIERYERDYIWHSISTFYKKYLNGHF